MKLFWISWFSKLLNLRLIWQALSFAVENSFFYLPLFLVIFRPECNSELDDFVICIRKWSCCFSLFKDINRTDDIHRCVLLVSQHKMVVILKSHLRYVRNKSDLADYNNLTCLYQQEDLIYHERSPDGSHFLSICWWYGKCIICSWQLQTYCFAAQFSCFWESKSMMKDDGKSSNEPLRRGRKITKNRGRANRVFHCAHTDLSDLP